MSKITKTSALFLELQPKLSTNYLLHSIMLVFFLLYSFQSFYGQTTSTCDFKITLGESKPICIGEEIVLIPELAGIPNCNTCTTTPIKNTASCNNPGNRYVLWFHDQKKNKKYYYRNVDLVWEENDDDTATIKGMVVNDAGENYEVDILYTDKTTTTDEHKEHSCYNEDSSDWTYYETMSGTLTKEDGSWSITMERRGVPFQVGYGANSTESVKGRYGASGWFDTSIDRLIGDVNINIEECPESKKDEISYLWSTGETTATIKVTPEESTAYTVTAIGCDGCEASALVELNTATIGIESVQDCLRGAITLIAEEGESYLWSTGETSQSITVRPIVATDYNVTVKLGDCEFTNAINVFLECTGSKASVSNIIAYPSPAVQGQELLINFSSTIVQELQYSLYNLSGGMTKAALIGEVTKGINTMTIDISELSSGIYILKIDGVYANKATETIVIE